jgi:predicted nucleic acid-binding Zn ribbon protein
MTRRREPIPLGAAIAELTAAMQPRNALARVQSAWAQAAGPTVSDWAVPVSERAGVVTFACTDSMVAHELELLKPQLLEKLSAALPGGAPTDLRFVIR